MRRTFALLAAVCSMTVLAEERPAPPAVAPSTKKDLPLALQPLWAEYPDRFRIPKGGLPTGFHLVTEPRWSLVAAGLSTFGVATALQLWVAFSTRTPLHAVPFGGQLLAVADLMRSSSGWGAFGILMFGGLAAIIDIAAQLAGVVLLIVGVAAPTRWMERDAPSTVHLVPGAPGTPAGASLVGRF